MSDTPSFKKWYEENQDSEGLWEEYCEEKCSVDYEVGTFRQWCRDRYDWLLEHGHL